MSDSIALNATTAVSSSGASTFLAPASRGTRSLSPDDSDAALSETEAQPGKKKRGRESPLTAQQQKVVRRKFPEWEKLLFDLKLHLGKYDKDGPRARDPDEITEWVDRAVEEIKTSPLFGTVNDTSSKTDRIIKDMFRNYRNNTYVKKNQHQAVQEAIAALRTNKTVKTMDASKAADVLLSFKIPAPAKDLFRQQNHDQILEESVRMRAAAAQTREEAGVDREDVDKRKDDNGGGFYQRALTKMWRNADQDTYNKMASEVDIFKNQQKFPAAMKTALKAVSEGGALGPTEIFMLYGFRSKNGQVKFGRPDNGHPPPHFLKGDDKHEPELLQWWSHYCETNLPKLGIVKKAQSSDVSPYIKYKDGIPVFVGLNLMECLPSTVGKVLKAFLNELWDSLTPDYSCPRDQEYPSIPLLEIYANPEDFYDTNKYNFPIRLTEVETLKVADLCGLAEYLSQICAPSCPEPFTFQQKSEIKRRRALRSHEDELDCMTGQEIIDVGVRAGLVSEGSHVQSEPLPMHSSTSFPLSAAVNVPPDVPNVSPLPSQAVSTSLPAVSNAPPVIPNSPVSNVSSLPSASSAIPITSSRLPVAQSPNVLPPALNNTSNPLATLSVSSVAGPVPIVVPNCSSTLPTMPIIPPTISHITADSSIIADSSVTSTPAYLSTGSVPMLPVPSTPSAQNPPQAEAIPARMTRKSRGRTQKNQKTESGDVDSVAGSSNVLSAVASSAVAKAAVISDQEVRRSSRPRAGKRPNLDPISQPAAAKRQKRKPKFWASLVKQPNGQDAMNADGDAILVDKNGKFLKKLENWVLNM
ncbi:hypothetical protein FB446DRAFT_709215 [Lentinula raphanica]|nr:hypothetical protein FB446DRAFT_709215 [Lentinula raphanica]